MKLKKLFILLLSTCFLFTFTSCIKDLPDDTSSNPPSEDPSSTPPKEDEPFIPHNYTPPEEPLEDTNPTVGSTTAESQDFIFNTDSVGTTTITMRRSEWNKMLIYFDYFYKNENAVIAESYEYQKYGQTWKLNTVGLRLRGNTSRFRPQGKDTPTDETGHKQPNADWSQDYYNYAATCPDTDYRQSHFKVDFEPFDDDDRKMSDCMKSVALKRCDSLFSREIFCYNLFHQYGIWTAPRASQTKVYINFIEDDDGQGNVLDDITDCKTTQVDFGVYEMFEEVNKQSLKGRMKKKKNNSAENAWENNDGDLWKCCGGDLTSASNVASNFGCEQVEILNTEKEKSLWSWVWFGPCYDLKTNKGSVDTATVKFQGFISELNALSNTDQFTDEGLKARKDFYEKWFDVDFFIKTYAVNMLVGMDDDYWGNANNYYLYFDNAKGGSGKCYLIPYDYDNTLGCSITGDKTYTNPFEWGNGKNRPLLGRLLEVPEYAAKLKATLLEVSSQDSNSPWNKDNCIALWNKWHAQVMPYVSTPDIKDWPNIGSTSVNDDGAWKEKKHYLTQDADNLYEQVSLNFHYWLSGKECKINFDLNGGSLNEKTGVQTIDYNGINSRFDAMIGTPARSGYEFVGWTKTKNGTDYTENYAGEENLTVYASWLDISGVKGLSIFEIKDSSYDGIKLCIINLPENHYRRTFYINGKEVGGDSCENPDKYKKIWAYPFTESGKSYEVYVSYSNKDYGWLADSNHITIKATSGKGEFKVTNKPSYYIDNNILKWKTEPVIQLGNSNPIREDNNWDEYYLIEVQTTKKKDTADSRGYHDSWNYQSWNWLGASCNTKFNFKDHVNADVLDGTRYDLCFRLRYNYNSSPYGDLCLIIYDYGDVDYFNLK